MSSSGDEHEETPPPVKPVAKTKAKGLRKSRGTGFEAYFADAPMTSEEAAYEKEHLYNPDLPLSERLEAGIARYRAGRRLPSDLKAYFDHYLFLGGIDTEQRQFAGTSGMSKQELEHMDADDVRDLSAVDKIHKGKGGSARYYHEGDEGWVVDFTGVAAGFFSQYVPWAANLDFQAMTRAINLVDNFLRYLLHHDVCPEHEDDVRRAIALCDTARVDLPLAHAALIRFPGQFNLACTELYCADEPPFLARDHDKAFRRPGRFSPSIVFQICVMLRGNDGQIERVLRAGDKHPPVCVVGERHADMEVVSISLPTEAVRKECRTIHASEADKAPITAFGSAVLQPCRVEEGISYGPGDKGFSREEAEAARQTFLLDDMILILLRPGMKLRVTLCDLNIGLTFIKSCHHILVPWYTFLPQALMQDFKDPAPDPRPAPSADDDGDGVDGEYREGDE